MKRFRIIPGTLLLLIVSAFSACTDPIALDTPREYIDVFSRDPGPEAVTVRVSINGTAQSMEVVPNRLLCQVDMDAVPTVVSFAMEFQGSDAGQEINSIYIRGNAVPIDGNAYSLSGDPENPAAPAASKLITRFGGTLDEIIPSRTSGSLDNFQIRFRTSTTEGTLTGEFTYSTASVRIGSARMDLSGSFTVNYHP